MHTWIGVVHVLKRNDRRIKSGQARVVVTDLSKNDGAIIELAELPLTIVSINAKLIKPVLLDAFAIHPHTGELSGEQGVGQTAALDGEDLLRGNLLLTGELRLRLTG